MNAYSSLIRRGVDCLVVGDKFFFHFFHRNTFDVFTYKKLCHKSSVLAQACNYLKREEKEKIGLLTKALQFVQDQTIILADTKSKRFLAFQRIVSVHDLAKVEQISRDEVDLFADGLNQTALFGCMMNYLKLRLMVGISWCV